MKSRNIEVFWVFNVNFSMSLSSGLLNKLSFLQSRLKGMNENQDERIESEMNTQENEDNSNNSSVQKIPVIEKDDGLNISNDNESNLTFYSAPSTAVEEHPGKTLNGNSIFNIFKHSCYKSLIC